MVTTSKATGLQKTLLQRHLLSPGSSAPQSRVLWQPFLAFLLFNILPGKLFSILIEGLSVASTQLLILAVQVF